jgi:hypothetical protein
VQSTRACGVAKMGVLVMVVALAVVGFGLFQHLKGKRILAAPFKKTGDLARDPTSPDPKGAVSTEGAVVAPAQALLSPCSKTPCLYYEVKVERLYEKEEKTQDGWKTVKGTDTLDTLKSGALASLDDGSGAVPIDFSKGADFDNFKEGFKKELNGRGWSSNIQFGQLSYDVPPIGASEGHTIGFKATEKLVPVEGNLFVLGKIDGGRIVKPSWRSMMASSKGRDGLLASTAKKKKLSLIGGGIGAVAAIPLMLFGPSMSDSSAGSGHCQSTLADAQASCSDNVSSKYGNDYAWTVAKDGQFEVSVTPPSGKKYAIDPQIVIKNAAGEVVADESALGPGAVAKAALNLKAGAYTVTVKDLRGDSVKGGYDYQLAIAAVGGVAAARVAEAGAEAAGSVVQIEAPKLAAELMAKKAHYDGKTIEVKGVVEEVQTDPDMTIVVFATPDAPNGEPTGVTASLPAKAKVKKGQLVVIRGIAVDDDSGIILSSAELVGGKQTASAPKGKAAQPRSGK